MDPVILGRTIAELRKKKGLTQAELAERLRVSDKTVSKWENGSGYPEITQIPALAKVFSVTTDRLLSEEREGITVAGTVICDIVKNVDYFPEKGMLANILSTSRSVGGCVCNTAVDLARIDRTIPVSAIGKTGDDEYGDFIISVLQSNGVDASGIIREKSAATSFSDVISLASGERTFFSCRGANATFSPDEINAESLSSKMLHVGYIFLLDKFDGKDDEYGTGMAKLLARAQAAGIKTSVDMVSGNDIAQKAAVAVAAFKFCDYVIVNELEACGVAGVPPRKKDGTLDVKNVRKAMEYIMNAGVREKVIVHAREGGFCLSVNGDFTAVGSLCVPKEIIKGNVGAGDAFCAGCLYYIYKGKTDEEILSFASAAAAISLTEENSVDGMRSEKEILKFAGNFSRR